MSEYNCPTCKKQTIYSKANPYRPFCCERCKLIDLGAWATQSHAIAGKSVAEEMFSEDFENIRLEDQH